MVGRLVDFATNAGVSNVNLGWNILDAGFVRLVANTATDPTGNYYVSLPSAGMYAVSIGPGNFAATVYVPRGFYTTDLFDRRSDCPFMYGVVFDASTGQPVSGATVTWVDTDAVSQGDGRYVLNLGCRSNGYGTGTSGIFVAHPRCLRQSTFGPRREQLGFGGSRRLDFALRPRIVAYAPWQVPITDLPVYLSDKFR